MSAIRVYLVALSNPISDRTKYERLVAIFAQAGIELELSSYLEQDLPPITKAADFNKAVRSGRYAWIADVSGGDLANLVLPYLDYEAYAHSRTIYCAFSDGTCIVNALAVKAQRRALLFPLWNQVSMQQAIRIFQGQPLDMPVQSLRGPVPWPKHARLAGGNIRCFLKLAGTSYMPCCKGGYLVLESMSADWNAFRSMSAHLSQAGAFQELQGIVLGRFNVLETQFGSRQATLDAIVSFLEPLCENYTDWFSLDTFGHIPNSTALWVSPHPMMEVKSLVNAQEIQSTAKPEDGPANWVHLKTKSTPHKKH